MHDSFREWWNHLLKRDRGALIRLGVVGALGLALLWWGGPGHQVAGSVAASADAVGGAAPTPTSAVRPGGTSNPLAAETEWLNGNLKALLEAIPGSGQVTVEVTLTRGIESQYVGGSNSAASSGSSTGPVVLNNLSGSQSLAVMDELGPEVQGVVVVASGAGSPEVRQELQKAVTTLFDLQPYQVLVLPTGAS